MYIKVNNEWSMVSYIYKKVNNVYQQITEPELHQYLLSNPSIFKVHVHVRVLSIYSQDNITAETCQCLAYDGNTELISVGTWSIISGNTYASISQTGLVTINSTADNSQITVRFDYDDCYVEKNMIVTYLSGASATTEVEVVENEDGSTTTTTTTTTDNGDGTSTSSSTATTYDENGDVSQTVETTTTDDGEGNTTSNSTTTNADGSSTTNQTSNNADGSSTSSTTNYDTEGNPTDTENVSTDTTGNVDTQNIDYNEDGDPVVTGYTIDTTASEGEGNEITGTGVNTEFYPFDNSDGWEMHIRFRTVKTEQPNPPIVIDTEDTGANYHFTIVCAKSPYKPWPGFHIRWTLSKTNYNSGNLVIGYTPKGSTSSTNKNLAIAPSSGENANIYDFTVAYDPKLKKYPSKFRCIDNFGRGATISYNYDFDPIEYEFTIGYNINQQGQPYRYSNVTIYEFSINKL